MEVCCDEGKLLAKMEHTTEKGLYSLHFGTDDYWPTPAGALK